MSQMISSARTQCTVHRPTCLPWKAGSQRKTCWHARQVRPTAACRAAFGTVTPGKGRRATRAAAEKFPAEGTAIGTMFRPPGPAHLYPEVEKGFEELLKSAEALEAQAIQEALNARYAEGNPYLERLDRANDWLNTIESPPEWGRPDEGNPNQPRRPPEYQPPQEPVPGIGKPLPEFDPPERSPTSPPMPQDDPMRPLPPEQPEIPPNERNPLRRAPDEIPGKDEPNERPDEQTQPRPGEVSASPDTANMRSILNDEEMEMYKTAEYVQYCRDMFEIEDLVGFYIGENNLPVAALTHPTGSTAIVYLHGANVTSWTTPEGQQLMRVNSQPEDDVIKGGIPICFPNVGHHPSLPTDGLLQDMQWSVVGADRSGPLGSDPAPQVTLYTKSDERSYAKWPHHFDAIYTVQLMVPDDFPEAKPTNRPVDMEDSDEEEDEEIRPEPRGKNSLDASSSYKEEYEPAAEPEPQQQTMQLRCELKITNLGGEPFTFTSGLRSHLACRNLHAQMDNPLLGVFVRMLGLGAKNYIDYSPNPLRPRLQIQNANYLDIGMSDIERMYIDAYNSTVKYGPGDQTHFEVLLRQGLTDLGVMNRGVYKDNFNPDHGHHVVLTGAQLGRPVTLHSAESWTGEYALRWHDKYWELPPFDRRPIRDRDDVHYHEGTWEDHNAIRDRTLPPLPPRPPPRRRAPAPSKQ